MFKKFRSVPSSKPQSPAISCASDHSLLVSFGSDPGSSTFRNILRLTRLLLQEDRKGVLNIHPAYTSVLISFDPLTIEPAALEDLIHQLLDGLDTPEVQTHRTIAIPVCYEGEFAPDLEQVARHTALTPDEVVRVHSSGIYTVRFLGFVPGFPYLAGLSERIATPRRASPRLRVEAGSVGIAGTQTGIYPDSSPGGWQIIGRTPIRLFDRSLERPNLLTMGDEVRFERITPARYAEQARITGGHPSGKGT